MKAFWVQMIDLDLFFDISRDVAMATNFGQNLQNDIERPDSRVDNCYHA